MRWLAVLGFVGMLSGCGDEVTVSSDMAVKPDAGPDMTVVVPLGGPCMVSTDCKGGTRPTCIKARGATTGYCSADCQDDGDCGDKAVCIATSDTRNQCVLSCETGADCPMGQVCWFERELDSSTPACFPNNGFLTCDPTSATDCMVGGVPGGCDRKAYGEGNTGECIRRCTLGVFTCPATNESCFAIDKTKDSDGNPTGDTMKGTFCDFILPQILTEGAECKYIDPSTMMPTDTHYYNICGPGMQCDILLINPSGSQNCHTLCYEPGFTPPNPPTMFRDGGMVFAGCPGATTCQNVYGMFGTTYPVGLCK